MMIKKLIQTLLLLAASVSAYAGVVIGMGGAAGTAGSGMMVAFSPAKAIGFRAGIASASAGSDFSASDIDYSATLNLDSKYFLADWHVFEGGLRLSAGMFLNGNNFSATATTDAGNINTLAAGQTVSIEANITFPEIAPYVGFGWGSTNESGLSFGLDFGVMLQGAPTASLKETDGLNILTQSDLDSEANSMTDDLQEFQLYPVAMASLSYHF